MTLVAADPQQSVDEHAEDLGAIGGLGDINKFSKGDPNIKVLEKLYKHDPETILEEKEKTSIGFILGQAYGDTGCMRNPSAPLPIPMPGAASFSNMIFSGKSIGLI